MAASQILRWAVVATGGRVASRGISYHRETGNKGEKNYLVLTLLELQAHFRDNPVKFQVLCPHNGTAVLKGIIEISHISDRYSILNHINLDLRGQTDS